jgi:hypothetical protein
MDIAETVYIQDVNTLFTPPRDVNTLFTPPRDVDNVVVTNIIR